MITNHLSGMFIAAALALAVAAPVETNPAWAGELSTNEIVDALKPARKTRSITAAETPELSPELLRLIDQVKPGGTREIVVEERKQIATALDKAELPEIDLTIPFDYDSAAISEHALSVLDRLGNALQDPALASSKFLVGGHTDASGSDAYNLKLSQRRAEAIKSFLIQAYPIDKSRLVPVGFGEMQLKNPQAPDAAENRRVQLINLGG